jgi:zeaxanthin glucosyltransferase
MARIVFAMMPEPGHLFPTYKLAKELRSRGHSIHYLVAEWCEKHLRDQGLDYTTGSEALWHAVFSAGPSNLEDANRTLLDFKAEALKLLRSTAMDLIIVDGFLHALALIARDYGSPAILLHTNFHNVPRLPLESDLRVYSGASGSSPSSLNVIELILCPRDLDFSRVSTDGRTRYHIEPSVDLEREEPDFFWGNIDDDRPLIYCSLGSQSSVAKDERKKLLQAVLGAMAVRQDCRMVLSIGTRLTAADFRSPPPNVMLVNWAPQLTVLRKASVMINHGGLGTVKECILCGVPMIIFPLLNDQPMNAARVVYHGLGLRGDMRHASVEGILSSIRRLESDDSYKTRIEAMRDRFLEAETSLKGPNIIEKFLALHERKRQERNGSPHQRDRSLSRA